MVKTKRIIILPSWLSPGRPRPSPAPHQSNIRKPFMTQTHARGSRHHRSKLPRQTSRSFVKCTATASLRR